MSFRMICAALIAANATMAPAQTADPVLPEFDAAFFSSSAVNPWFPLIPGETRILAALGEEGGEGYTERSELTVLGDGPVIMGVPTITIRDAAYEDGILVEQTYDFFAADVRGNVWYMGEDVTNYRYDDAGTLTGTDSASSWRAGVNGAQPGIIMPIAPEVGVSFFQEHAPEDAAMDYGTVVSTTEAYSGPAGSFRDVVRFFESSTIEPEAAEYKLYAPGIGLIRVEEGLDRALENPDLVFELQG